jgi:hypothetical protein
MKHIIPINSFHLNPRKTLLCFLFFWFFSFANYAQNLVPNGSFEEISNCPESLGQVYLAPPWFSVLGTPDLFNSCYTLSSDGVGVPMNGTGFQNALGIDDNSIIGQGYTEITTFAKNYPDAREILGVELLCPLVVGHTYSVSCNFSRCDNYTYDCATNQVGLKFTTNILTANDPSIINNSSNIYSQEIITNKEEWTEISGSFTADSAYAYIYIGNFFSDANTDTTECASFATYYVDRIQVLPMDSTECLNLNSEILWSDKTFIYPNPAASILTVRTTKKIDEIFIFDLLGNQVFTDRIGLNSTEINVSGLSSGIYSLVIHCGTRIIHGRFQKLNP